MALWFHKKLSTLKKKHTKYVWDEMTWGSEFDFISSRNQKEIKKEKQKKRVKQVWQIIIVESMWWVGGSSL